MEGNPIYDKALAYAVRVVNMYKFLNEEKQERVMSKQLLRCGTSIGANCREAIYAQSTLDFINKLSIALKEASETEFWLELLHDSTYIDDKSYESIHEECVELIKLLTSIIKSTKSTL